MRVLPASTGVSSAPSCSYSCPPRVLVQHNRRVQAKRPRAWTACNAQLNRPVVAAAVDSKWARRPLGLPFDIQFKALASSEPFSIDVLGIGQAMVDINALASEQLIAKLDVSPGGRRVLQSIEERSDVLQTLDDEECTTQLSAGGSLANSLFAIGQLGGAAASAPHFRRRLAVSMSGSCGGDHLGQFFASQMQRSGVSVDASAGGPTGTVMVLTDPTGERSFLSYFGESNDQLRVQPHLRKAIAQAKMVVIEGYLWEMPGALPAIREIIALARETGAQVALTAGDPGVVARHRAEVLEVLACGVDFFFCNLAEARQLIDEPDVAGYDAAARLGSLAQAAVVTAGSHGSFVGFMGLVHEIPAALLPPEGIVSTNGAGDAFCGGFLFALSHGHSITEAASFAARVAVAVISRHGAQLALEDAEALLDHLPSHPAVPQGLLSTAASLLP